MRSRLFLFCLLITQSLGADMLAPDGFEVRDFGPVGGQIIVPSGWFVTESNRGTQYLFTVSKEDLATTGHYETGWRIQWIAGISKIANITATQAVELNIDRKKKSESVVRECDPENLGDFKRRCLETIAPDSSKPGKKYRIIYSFFWSDEKDMMVAGTFGAPLEEWDTAAKIYQVIKDMTLLDWDRFEAKKRAAAAPSKL